MTDSKKTKHFTIALALLALIVFLDQGSKCWIDKKLPIQEGERIVSGSTYHIQQYVPLPGETKPVQPIRVIPDFFHIVHTVNKGAAWGIFYGKMNLLMLVSLVALIGMLVFFSRICEGFNERVWGLGLLMGGTAGNLIDRMDLIKRGNGIHGVVDFISVKYWPGKWWPAFNIADAAICVSIFILCISTFLRPDKDGNRSPLADKIMARFDRTQGKEA